MNNNTVVEGKRIDEIGKDAAGEQRIAEVGERWEGEDEIVLEDGKILKDSGRWGKIVEYWKTVKHGKNIRKWENAVRGLARPYYLDPVYFLSSPSAHLPYFKFSRSTLRLGIIVHYSSCSIFYWSKS